MKENFLFSNESHLNRIKTLKVINIYRLALK